jgi:hypothetical protein
MLRCQRLAMRSPVYFDVGIDVLRARVVVFARNTVAVVQAQNPFARSDRTAGKRAGVCSGADDDQLKMT